MQNTKETEEVLLTGKKSFVGGCKKNKWSWREIEPWRWTIWCWVTDIFERFIEVNNNNSFNMWSSLNAESVMFSKAIPQQTHNKANKKIKKGGCFFYYIWNRGICLWYFQFHPRLPYACLSKPLQLGLKCIHADRLEARVAQILHFSTRTKRWFPKQAAARQSIK